MFDFLFSLRYQRVAMAVIKHFLLSFVLGWFWSTTAIAQPYAVPPAATNRAVPPARINPRATNVTAKVGTTVATNSPGKPSTNSVAAATRAYRIPPNTILEAIIPLTAAARVSVQSSKNPMVYTAREAICVPFGFSPTNLNKILIISGTSDGEGSSIRAMRSFTNIALRLGWVVVAADGPTGKPQQDNPPWRWAMLSSVLDHIHTAWPGSRNWPVACAGFSGGAKWSALMGAILSQKGYNVVGTYMGGCNQDMASEAARLYWPATKFKKTPMFLSSGSEDTIATPAHHVAVKESMLDNGFERVRLEGYKGGHNLDEATLRTALYWFFEEVMDRKGESQSSTTPTTDSTGDKKSSDEPVDLEPESTEPTTTAPSEGDKL